MYIFSFSTSSYIVEFSVNVNVNCRYLETLTFYDSTYKIAVVDILPYPLITDQDQTKTLLNIHLRLSGNDNN